MLEGDASSTARWRDGITARLVAVERVPNSWGVDIPKSRALVRLRYVIGNEGAGPLPIEPHSSWVTLFYGVNRTEGEREAGYSYDNPKENERKGLNGDNDPTRIMPGTKATYVETYAVPIAELGSLVAAASPPAEEGIRDSYTFLGVEKVLVEVK
ncbi:hypothetical protein [Micromonospora sp. NPDC001898]|uniref:hypothetical protein n=1 Tax=Micromonospora sp. NPDC001898 TaxID=3364221 RepID=UPI0036C8ECEF